MKGDAFFPHAAAPSVRHGAGNSDECAVGLQRWWGGWRYYAPASFDSIVPIAVADEILADMGFASVEELNGEFHKYRRGEIPPKMQERVKHILTGEEIDLQHFPTAIRIDGACVEGGEAVTVLANPIKPADDPSPLAIQVYGFGASARVEGIEFNLRVAISAERLYVPVKDEWAEVCRVLIEKNGDLIDECLRGDDLAVLRNFLQGLGLAPELLGLKGFQRELGFQVIYLNRQFGIGVKPYWDDAGKPLDWSIDGNEKIGFITGS